MRSVEEKCGPSNGCLINSFGAASELYVSFTQDSTKTATFFSIPNAGTVLGEEKT